MRKSKVPSRTHWVDRLLDILLFSFIAIGILFIIASLLFDLNQSLIRFMKGMDVLFLGIIFLDMSRNFLKSRGWPDFLKHQWLDVIVLIIIIISYSTFFVLGVGRLSWLIQEEKTALWLGELLESGLLARILRFF